MATTDFLGNIKMALFNKVAGFLSLLFRILSLRALSSTLTKRGSCVSSDRKERVYEVKERAYKATYDFCSACSFKRCNCDFPSAIVTKEGTRTGFKWRRVPPGAAYRYDIKNETDLL